MEYDFRKSSGSSYDSNISSFNRSSSSAAAHPSLYPKVGGTGSHSINSDRSPPFHHAPLPPSAPMMGIRVSVKPQYRITPPPTLLPQMGEIPRSNFHYDFEYEKNVMAESMKEKQNWSRFVGIEKGPQRIPESSNGPGSDPVVGKYIASGLSREAVPLAVANYGDNPTKVKEFAKGYSLLREMGFSPNSVAEALIMYDNDADKALAHFLNNTS